MGKEEAFPLSKSSRPRFRTVLVGRNEDTDEALRADLCGAGVAAHSTRSPVQVTSLKRASAGLSRGRCYRRC